MRPFQDIQVNNLLRSIMCTILNEGGRLGVLKKFSGSWWEDRSACKEQLWWCLASTRTVVFFQKCLLFQKWPVRKWQHGRSFSSHALTTLSPIHQA